MKRNLQTPAIVSIELLLLAFGPAGQSQDSTDQTELLTRSRARGLGVSIGGTSTGKWNAITDVPGVKVGHHTQHRGKDVHTGVTVIVPHGDNVFQEKVPAAVVVGNGFGKLAGSTQIEELGNIETPIALTNTLSVATAVNALVRYTLAGNETVQSVNAVVGETNDGRLNEIRGLHVKEDHVLDAIEVAKSGPVAEGSVGAGSGTVAFGYKGGIGTSSRVVKGPDGNTYTVGVLVQSNYGGDLRIDGIRFGDKPEAKLAALSQPGGDGSCLIVVATDAPLSVRNLKRVAKRALHGMARTGASMSNGSGDYVISFSTAYRIPYRGNSLLEIPPLMGNDHITPLFVATMDATEEALLNSIFMATSVEGKHGLVEAIDLDVVKAAVRNRAESE